MHSSWSVWVYLSSVNRGLQAFAGIVTVSIGHCHPKVVDAVKRQSELLQHTTTIYLNPQIALYAKELTDRLPGNLKVTIQAPMCVVLKICLSLFGRRFLAPNEDPPDDLHARHASTDTGYRGRLVMVRAKLPWAHLNGQGCRLWRLLSRWLDSEQRCRGQ